MKKQLTVALGLAVLATPAFATKARLQALGEDSYGSFYINDNRNIWLNAAQINNHKDLVTYEFGSTVDQDTAATPRGEGGVFKTMGNMVYGIHFGGGSNTSNNLRLGAGLADVDLDGSGNITGATGTGSEQNNIDAFVGGDAGIKWGANLGYAKSSDQSQGLRNESLRTRLGVIMGDTQVYGNINLINNARGELSGLAGPLGAANGASKFEGKLGYQVGAIHAWEGNTLFVDYRNFEGEGTIAGTKEDQKLNQLQAGIGRVERLNDKSNLFLRASYVMAKAENDNAIAAAAGTFGAACDLSAYLCEEYETQRVPVVVGLETEAASWLTLRASVAQVVWGTEEDANDERTVNATAVNAGATLKFGELSVDGVIGNGTVAGDGFAVAGSTTNTAAGSGTGTGSLRLDQLMTRVGMTYRF
jgi:hypothetical protein